MIDVSELKFYLIFKDEKYLLYFNQYYGPTWTSDIKKAKIYLKLSSCRSHITSIFKKFPEFGICDIIEITGGSFQVLNEANRVQKSIEKIETERINRNKWQLEEKQKRIESELLKLQEELFELKNN